MSINNEPIELSGLNAAHFIANMNFHDNTDWRFPQRYVGKFINEDQLEQYQNKSVIIDNSSRYGKKIFITEDKYKTQEEWYKDMKPYQIARIQYIYNYLKENYSDTNYAEEFLHSESWGLNGYWAKELGIIIEDVNNPPLKP